MTAGRNTKIIHHLMGRPGIMNIPMNIPAYTANVIQLKIVNTRRAHSRRRNNPIQTKRNINVNTTITDADMIFCTRVVGAGTTGTASRTPSVTSRTLSVTGATTEFIQDNARSAAAAKIIPQAHIPMTEIAVIPDGRIPLARFCRPSSFRSRTNPGVNVESESQTTNACSQNGHNTTIPMLSGSWRNALWQAGHSILSNKPLCLPVVSLYPANQPIISCIHPNPNSTFSPALYFILPCYFPCVYILSFV